MAFENPDWVATLNEDQAVVDDDYTDDPVTGNKSLRLTGLTTPSTPTVNNVRRVEHPLPDLQSVYIYAKVRCGIKNFYGPALNFALGVVHASLQNAAVQLGRSNTQGAKCFIALGSSSFNGFILDFPESHTNVYHIWLSAVIEDGVFTYNLFISLDGIKPAEPQAVGTSSNANRLTPFTKFFLCAPGGVGAETFYDSIVVAEREQDWPSVGVAPSVNDTVDVYEEDYERYDDVMLEAGTAERDLTEYNYGHTVDPISGSKSFYARCLAATLFIDAPPSEWPSILAITEQPNRPWNTPFTSDYDSHFHNIYRNNIDLGDPPLRDEIWVFYKLKYVAAPTSIPFRDSTDEDRAFYFQIAPFAVTNDPVAVFGIEIFQLRHADGKFYVGRWNDWEETEVTAVVGTTYFIWTKLEITSRHFVSPSFRHAITASWYISTTGIRPVIPNVVRELPDHITTEFLTPMLLTRLRGIDTEIRIDDYKMSPYVEIGDNGDIVL